MLEHILLAFIPLFVAFDTVGVLPLFLGLTDGLEKQQRQRIVKQSLVTAFLLAVFFLFLGKSIFNLIGITVQDFMIAGGVLLFIIATSDLIVGRKLSRQIDDVGVVPLGVPLIVGPAVLTTELLLIDVHGVIATVIALILNIVVTGFILLTCSFWERVLGKTGSRAVSKIASLFLAAIAVMMIRKGIIQTIHCF